MKPQRTFLGAAGQKSIDNKGPEALKTDIDATNKMFDPNATHSDGTSGGIKVENLGSDLSGLADNGDYDKHHHDSDRARANHTGTQVASSISDFADAVRVTALSGLSTATNAVITADDTVLTAPGKLQKQIADNNSAAVHKSGTETVTGAKTFSGPINVPTPTDNEHAASKQYVDGKDAVAVHISGNETVSGTKTFPSSPVVPSPTASNQAANKEYVDGGLALKANAADVYSRANMQTSGQSQLHWDNLTNVPNLADKSWKAAVASRAALPLTGNSINDQRVVLNDGDSKQAVYICVATTGTVDQQWKKIGDVDWTNDHGQLVGLGDDDHVQYLNATRGDARYYTKSQEDAVHAAFVLKAAAEFTDDVQLNANELINVVIHRSSTAPVSPSLGVPVEGMLWYDTVNERLKVYKGTVAGWTDISSKGAVSRELEFTATAGQTVFSTSSVGSYTVGDKSMMVYKKGVSGRYELLDSSDYTETNNQTITLVYSAMLNDQYMLRWFEATPDLINITVFKDGTLQTNLNSDMLDGQHGSYYEGKINERALFKSGSGTFASGGTTCTVTDAFVTASSMVVVSPTAAKLGVWSVVSASGSFTITSDTTETNAVTFDWGCTK